LMLLWICHMATKHPNKTKPDKAEAVNVAA
jgi:hypothetical protein